MAELATARRSLLPHDGLSDYQLLVTLRLVLPASASAPPPPAAVRTAPGYLPRWRSAARRRRLPV